MMTDFEIRFDPSCQGWDMRPPGAAELLAALADAALGRVATPDNLDAKPRQSNIMLDPEDAADAHNYICALENQCLRLHRENFRLAQQIEGLLLTKASMSKVLAENNWAPPPPVFLTPPGTLPEAQP